METINLFVCCSVCQRFQLSASGSLDIRAYRYEHPEDPDGLLAGLSRYCSSRREPPLLTGRTWQGAAAIGRSA